MKARKLSSGRWNCRAYVGKDKNGKSMFRSYTADTKTEAERLAALNTLKSSRDMRVVDMVYAYMEGRKAVLSPTTYRSYVCLYHANIEKNIFGERFVSTLNNPFVQRWIADISKDHAPKTVRNCYGLFSAAVSYFFPEMRFNVKLPQSKQPELHTPTTQEVLALIDYAKGTDHEMYKAILLGAVGMMRRGEIAALTASDIDFENNTVSITKSLARNAENKYVIKPPKNKSSNMVISLPQFVIDTFPKKGSVVSLTPKKISERFRTIVKRSGLPHFRFHDLRHYAASIAASSWSIPINLPMLSSREHTSYACPPPPSVPST